MEQISYLRAENRYKLLDAHKGKKSEKDKIIVQLCHDIEDLLVENSRYHLIEWYTKYYYWHLQHAAFAQEHLLEALTDKGKGMIPAENSEELLSKFFVLCPNGHEVPVFPGKTDYECYWGHKFTVGEENGPHY